MISKSTTSDSYILKFQPRLGSENGSPFFSFGKLLHVAQNISSKYAEHFSIKEDSEYQFNGDDIERVETISIELPEVSVEIADSIAEDLCAFLKLDKVEITKITCERHTVVESI